MALSAAGTIRYANASPIRYDNAKHDCTVTRIDTATQSLESSEDADGRYVRALINALTSKHRCATGTSKIL